MPDLEAARLVDYFDKIPIDKEAVAFFSAIPHANAYLTDTKTLRVAPFYSRVAKKDGSDSFFAEIINSEHTIPQALLLLRNDIASLEYKFGAKAEGDVKPDTVALVHLAPKLTGYRDTIHGGILASVLDEIVGFNVDGLCSCAEAQENKRSRQRLYTAYLNTTYRRPVPPGVYAVESRLVKRDGRKWFLKGRIVGKNDETYVEADVLYIQSKDSVL